LSRLKENFGLKVLFSFILVIVVVLSVFTLFAVVREGKKAKEDLRAQGDMLSSLLSRGLVVGVFAENEQLLTDAAEGIMGLENVVSVSIYNADFKMLCEKGGTSSEKDAFPLRKDRVDAMRRVQSLTVVETPKAFEFAQPIMLKAHLTEDESLYFGRGDGGDGDKGGKVIGYVRIVLSKDAYHKEILSVVLRNAAIMLIFISASIVIIYVAVKKVTRPLAALTRSVKAIEKGMRVEQVPVETGDEIGNLASAFNAMIVARGLAEESLRSVVSEMSLMESRIEERERHLIAADLHDFVGQNLAVLLFKLAALRKTLSSPEVNAHLEEIRELIGRTIQYTRSLTVELSPPVLSELGFLAAVESLAEGTQKTHGIRISIADDGKLKQADDETRYLLFRIIRELLMNIVKHAQASAVKICLTRNDDIMHIAVEDNGVGFDAKKAAGRDDGFGLFTIRERLKRMGGYFAVDSRPGLGTKVVLSVPLKPKLRDQKGPV
jgi:signal transduction histidine kinase